MATGALTLVLKDQFGRVKFRRRGYAVIMLETTDLALGATEKEKFVDGIRLEMAQVILDNPADLQVTIKYRNNLADSLVSVGPFNLAEGMDFIDTRLTAKFFRVRIEAFSNTVFFIFSILEFYGAVAGARR